MLVGLWENLNTYRFTNEATGRSVPIILPEAQKMDKLELADIVAWQREWAEKELSIPAKPQMTKGQQNDLGTVLLEVRQSKRNRKERSGHGKWF